MRTSWNLKLFYPSRTSQAIERDITRTEKKILAFERAYKGKTNYLKQETALFKALQAYEKLNARADASRAHVYFFLQKELDASNAAAVARMTKIEEKLTKLGNRILFFTLALGKIPPKDQKRFLKSRKLEMYRYFLERLFLESRHDLSEAEEKILNLKAHTSYDMWVDGVERVVAQKTVRFRGKDIPLDEALGKIPTLGTVTRRGLSDAVMEELRTASDFAESELNAVVLNKKVNDELRGFTEPYEATIQHYENNTESVLSLVKAVTDAYPVSHAFHDVKRKLLGLKTLRYADRSAAIGTQHKKIPFQESCETYRRVLLSVDRKYASIFDSFLNRGQIDVYPKKGKSGGAYCLGLRDLPTMVLLNHTDNMRSFMTLAHEMGHAIHTEMSKRQPVLYQGYSTATAETASTLFERLAFDAMFETLSRREKVVALHDKLNDDISTIFRQIAFFNFELDLHRRIRAEGYLPKEEIAKLLNVHMKAYLGPHMRLADLDGYFFVHVSHFRRFFYVYTYAYGQLISRIIAKRFKRDPSYRKEIRQFLSAGGSMTPEDIFKSIGINTLKPDFFAEGIQSIKKDIDTLKKLTT